MPYSPATLDGNAVLEARRISLSASSIGPAHGLASDPYGRSANPWESFAIEPEQYLDAGDKVVALIRLSARGKGSGVPVERNDGMVWTAREGKAVRLEVLYQQF
jgi:hypothetical protein